MSCSKLPNTVYQVITHLTTGTCAHKPSTSNLQLQPKQLQPKQLQPKQLQPKPKPLPLPPPRFVAFHYLYYSIDTCTCSSQNLHFGQFCNAILAIFIYFATKIQNLLVWSINDTKHHGTQHLPPSPRPL